MKMITGSDNVEVEWANIVEEEILKDCNNEWWWPKSNKHDIFEAAYMKFVNGNLNYFNFGNMVAAVLEKDCYNKNLPRTLDFCNYSRLLTGNLGPFGRMCVWKLPAGKVLKRHVDNFKYHRQIVRNIFIVSNHSSESIKIIINDESVKFQQGTLFQFFPATEYHEFHNTSNRDFYFLGYDFWIIDHLKKSIEEIAPNIYELMFDQDRLKKFGAEMTTCKFMSGH